MGIQVICPPSENGLAVFVPHPYECQMYFMCQFEVGILMECPGNLQFDTILNICNYPENVACENSTPQPETTTENQETTTEEQETTTENQETTTENQETTTEEQKTTTENQDTTTEEQETTTENQETTPENETTTEEQ